MPNLHVVDDAPMTRKLVAAGAFAEDPLVVVDVGARGGIDQCWEEFGKGVRVIGFEPDAEEYARLIASPQENIEYLQMAVSGEVGSKTFHIANFPAASSLYPNDQEWCGRFGFAENMVVVSKARI